MKIPAYIESLRNTYWQCEETCPFTDEGDIVYIYDIFKDGVDFSVAFKVYEEHVGYFKGYVDTAEEIYDMIMDNDYKQLTIDQVLFLTI